MKRALACGIVSTEAMRPLIFYCAMMIQTWTAVLTFTSPRRVAARIRIVVSTLDSQILLAKVTRPRDPRLFGQGLALYTLSKYSLLERKTPEPLDSWWCRNDKSLLVDTSDRYYYNQMR
jgi:hypothetical protein